MCQIPRTGLKKYSHVVYAGYYEQTIIPTVFGYDVLFLGLTPEYRLFGEEALFNVIMRIEN